MGRMTGRNLSLTVAMTCLALAPAAGQEPPGPDEGWKDTAELSYVVTAGNSETNTFGFKNKLWRGWVKSSLELNAGGVRAEAEFVSDFFAVGTPNDFSVTREAQTDLTAESYYLNGRYDRRITDRFFWFTGGGWDRNRFAGIDNRYTGFGGLGNLWKDTERLKFRTDYAATYTLQDDVVENPEFDDSYAGLRLSYNYMQMAGASTTITSDLILDGNIEESQDFRANMLNAVGVAMNSRLALKVSLQWLYDNEPALVAIDLFDADPNQGGTQVGTVLVELDELDTILTTSLVINF